MSDVFSMLKMSDDADVTGGISSYKGHHFHHGCSTLMTLLKCKSFVKSSSPNSITSRVRESTYEFGGTQFRP